MITVAADYERDTDGKPCIDNEGLDRRRVQRSCESGSENTEALSRSGCTQDGQIQSFGDRKQVSVIP